MNWVERVHRCFIELSIFILVFIILKEFVYYPEILLFSAFISHLSSVILNGHLFAMFSHDLFWFSLYRDKKAFFQYILSLRNRLSQKCPDYLAGACFFGSLSRGVFKPTSDLDIRFFPSKGFYCAIRTSHLVFCERLRAFFAGFPIDAYMILSKSELQKKIDLGNECPVCVYSQDDKISGFLSEFTAFEEFQVHFFSDQKNSLEN
jgi:hypothetical protein